MGLLLLQWILALKVGLCKEAAVSVAHDFPLASVAVDLWNRKRNPWKKEPKQDKSKT